MKINIKKFLYYNNIIPIIMVFVVAGSAGAFAATVNTDKLRLADSRERVKEVDNSSILDKKISDLSGDVNVISVEEFTNYLVVSYSYESFGIKEGQWDKILKEGTLKIRDKDIANNVDSFQDYVNGELHDVIQKDRLVLERKIESVTSELSLFSLGAIQFSSLLGSVSPSEPLAVNSEIKFEDNNNSGTLVGVSLINTEDEDRVTVSIGPKARGDGSGNDVPEPVLVTFTEDSSLDTATSDNSLLENNTLTDSPASNIEDDAVTISDTPTPSDSSGSSNSQVEDTSNSVNDNQDSVTLEESPNATDVNSDQQEGDTSSTTPSDVITENVTEVIGDSLEEEETASTSSESIDSEIQGDEVTEEVEVENQEEEDTEITESVEEESSPEVTSEEEVVEDEPEVIEEVIEGIEEPTEEEVEEEIEEVVEEEPEEEVEEVEEPEPEVEEEPEEENTVTE